MKKILATALVISSLLILSCVRIEKVQKNEILRVKLFNEVNVYTNQLPDIATAKIFFDGEDYFYNRFYYTTEKHVYIMDPMVNSIHIYDTENNEKQSLSSLPLYENSLIKYVDDKKNIYMAGSSYLTYKLLEKKGRRKSSGYKTNIASNRIYSVNIVSAEEELLQYIPSIESNKYFYNIYNIFPAAGNTLLICAEEMDGPTNEGNFFFADEHRSVEKKLYIYKENSQRPAVYPLKTLQGYSSEDDTHKEISFLSYNKEKNVVLMLINLFTQNEVFWQVYAFNLNDKSLKRLYEIEADSKETPLHNGLTDDGELITGYHNEEADNYIITRHNVLLSKKQKTRIPLGGDFRNLSHFSVQAGSIRAIRFHNGFISFYKWQ